MSAEVALLCLLQQRMPEAGESKAMQLVLHFMKIVGCADFLSFCGFTCLCSLCAVWGESMYLGWPRKQQIHCKINQPVSGIRKKFGLYIQEYKGWYSTTVI